MARAWSFANVTACRAVLNPAWGRIFREISCLSPLNIGTLFLCCGLGHDLLPSHASLDSGVNEYLVGQRWQCQGSHGRGKSWKTMENEKKSGPGKVMENKNLAKSMEKSWNSDF